MAKFERFGNSKQLKEKISLLTKLACLKEGVERFAVKGDTAVVEILLRHRRKILKKLYNRTYQDLSEVRNRLSFSNLDPSFRTELEDLESQYRYMLEQRERDVHSQYAERILNTALDIANRKFSRS